MGQGATQAANAVLCLRGVVPYNAPPRARALRGVLSAAVAGGKDGSMTGAPATAESARLTELIALLKRRGLSYKQIAARLKHDFNICISSAAVSQRYARWEKRNDA